MHNYQKLKIWQMAMDKAEQTYRISSDFPKEEKFGLTSQIRRCAVSIPSNIAEGAGRNTTRILDTFSGLPAARQTSYAHNSFYPIVSTL